MIIMFIDMQYIVMAFNSAFSFVLSLCFIIFVYYRANVFY